MKTMGILTQGSITRKRKKATLFIQMIITNKNRTGKEVISFYATRNIYITSKIISFYWFSLARPDSFICGEIYPIKSRYRMFSFNWKN